MKILHAIHGFMPEYEGGTELYVQALARGLVEKGHQSAILAGSGHTRANEVLESEDVEGLRVFRLHRSGGFFHEEWGQSYSAAVDALFDRLLENECPDLLHVHHWKRLSRSLVARARRFGIPSVITFHDLWSTCARDFRMRDGTLCEARFLDVECETCVTRANWQSDGEVRGALEEYARDLADELRLASAMTAPSIAHRDRVADLHGIDRERIQVMPLAPVRKLEAGSRPAEPGFPKAPLRIGHWAHMNYVKGSHVLLEAIGKLRGKDRVEVHVYGGFVTPEYEARLRGLAEGLPVTFHGPFGPSDLEGAPLDIAVVPSVTAESFSFVIDEAFDLGLPVLGSDLGSLPERIGGAGASFPVGDAAALADRIDGILEEPGRLDRYRRCLPTERVRPGDHVAAMEAIYEKAKASALPGPPVDDAARHAARLVQATEQLEERRVSLLDLEARAEYLTAKIWKLECDLAEAREELRLEREKTGTKAPEDDPS